MAKLMDDTQEDNLAIAGSSFKFSAVKIDDLADLANDFTLVTICTDKSSSVRGFQTALNECRKEIIAACAKSARAENLLVRILDFNGQVEEVHGFKILNKIAVGDYVLNAQGGTALYDAAYSGIGATVTYAKSLTDQDFNVNGIVFVLTDGEDNSSKETPKTVAKLKSDALARETDIESLLTILIGVNVTDPSCSRYLKKFKDEGEFDQYEEIGNTSKESLAKLAQFVSKSISSQSQSLGTGGPSQTLGF